MFYFRPFRLLYMTMIISLKLWYNKVIIQFSFGEIFYAKSIFAWGCILHISFVTKFHLQSVSCLCSIYGIPVNVSIGPRLWWKMMTRPLKRQRRQKQKSWCFWKTLFLLKSCIRPHVFVIKMSHSSTSNYHCSYGFSRYCLGDLHIMIWFATGLLWSFWIPQMKRMVALQSRMPSHGNLLPQKVRRCSSWDLAFKFLLSFFAKKKKKRVFSTV